LHLDEVRSRRRRCGGRGRGRRLPRGRGRGAGHRPGPGGSVRYACPRLGGRAGRRGDAHGRATPAGVQGSDPTVVDGCYEAAKKVQVDDLLTLLAPHLPLPGLLSRVCVRIAIHLPTRSMYLSSRRSTRITSPSSMKSGTWTTAPVSSFAGFVP